MYTIRILKGGFEKRNQVLAYLQERLAKEGKFRAEALPINKGEFYEIHISRVRLVKPKPYCGNHPGSCPVGGPKKKTMTYLEWEDWVKFNGMVNRVLNRFKANADVWSNPMDVKGKMWIRKGVQARKRYDWTEEGYTFFGEPIRIWNQGTEDQFA